MLDAAYDLEKKGHVHARRIIRREHFKRLYARNPNDMEINPEAGHAITKALKEKFGADHFRHDRYHQKSGAPDFPVRLGDGTTVSSLAVSETLSKLPVVSVDFVFADRTMRKNATEWLESRKTEIIKPKEEPENNG